MLIKVTMPKRRQVWLLPPAIVATILFSLPFITVNHIPQESKLHEELSGFSGERDLVGAAAPSSRQLDKQVIPSDSGNNGHAPPRVLIEPDGFFNGVPLYYKESSSTYSSVHCIGETFQKKHHWIYRSCHYQNLCFDVTEQEFVLFQSPQDGRLNRLLRGKHNLAHVSTLLTKTDQNSVSIGGINVKWTWSEGVPRLKWSPKVVTMTTTSEPLSYYEMNATWIPFHSMAGFNPGHLVWDDWLPIYSLLKMFQLHSSNLVLTRYILPGKSMWATCDFNDNNKQRCQSMFQKFLPLMNTTAFSTNRDYQLKEKVPNRTRFICAKHGLAGIGMLTDHGIKTHGWEEDDYKYTHNHGRGSQLWDFRNFMISNILGDSKPTEIQGPPFKITFSIKSSHSERRGLDFAKQMQAVKSSLPKDLVEVQAYELKELSLEEQVRVATESSVFISVCGGGAVTATFLPRDASIILYFDATGGAKDNIKTNTSARLDWDFFEHASYLRTNWLPTETMDNDKELEVLVEIVKHELDVLQLHHYTDNGR